MKETAINTPHHLPMTKKPSIYLLEMQKRGTWISLSSVQSSIKIIRNKQKNHANAFEGFNRAFLPSGYSQVIPAYHRIHSTFISLLISSWIRRPTQEKESESILEFVRRYKWRNNGDESVLDAIRRFLLIHKIYGLINDDFIYCSVLYCYNFLPNFVRVVTFTHTNTEEHSFYLPI